MYLRFICWGKGRYFLKNIHIQAPSTQVSFIPDVHPGKMYKCGCVSSHKEETGQKNEVTCEVDSTIQALNSLSSVRVSLSDAALWVTYFKLNGLMGVKLLERKRTLPTPKSCPDSKQYFLKQLCKKPQMHACNNIGK